ncbi:hypothetical protein LguiA_023350 [Lonicera macranthoides]
MDPTADILSADQTEAGSSEKRPAEDGELTVQSPKKARREGILARDMKKVAEIVLVLDTLGKMRSERSPTDAEREMMADARGKLVELCQGFAPKDVFPREVFGGIIDDLGLSKLREERLGFRPLKMSIAEKLLLSKRKMEKLVEFPQHSGPCSSPQTQTKLGAATESHAMSNAGRKFPLNRPSGPIPSGGLQTASPLGHVSTAKSTSLPYQLPTSEVRPVISSGLPASQMGRDSSLALPRVERPPFRLDGRSNGSSYTSQVQVSTNSSGDHKMTKTPTWSVQPQSASLVKYGSDHKVTAQTSAKIEGSAATSSTSQHLQKVKQGPSPRNSHFEIGKIVKKLLHPQLPVHPEWTPPSRDYMNKALTCQTCKFAINEVGTVLVCDGCEKGYHLKCLQSNNLKAIPRGEWHCGKCLFLNNGKPVPPKYGRVMRNIPTTKVSTGSTSAQSSSEKKGGTSNEKVNQQGITAKVGTSNEVNQQGIIANGNSGNAASGAMGNHYSHSPPGLMMSDVSEMQGNILSSGAKMNDKPPGTCPNNLIKISGSAAVSPADSSCEGSRKEKIVTESNSQSPVKSGSVINSFDGSQAFGNTEDNDQTGLPKSAKISPQQCPDADRLVEETGKSFRGETLNSNPNHEAKEDERGCAQTNPVETSGASVRATGQASSSSDGLHDVDWAGDIINVADEKTYYQSCCINGVVYEVQDHALLLLDNKLLPSKLQAMWEDNKTRLKWVTVNRCYFPDDLSEGVVHPFPLESNEVYESNHDCTVMAGFIQGPCKVIHPSKFIEESEMGKQLASGKSDGQLPFFLCKWLYDESKGLFRSVSS